MKTMLLAGVEFRVQEVREEVLTLFTTRNPLHFHFRLWGDKRQPHEVLDTHPNQVYVFTASPNWDAFINQPTHKIALIGYENGFSTIHTERNAHMSDQFSTAYGLKMREEVDVTTAYLRLRKLQLLLT